MKLLITLLLLASPALADEYRHMVSFGAGGFGWSGAMEKMETEDSSAFSDVDYFFNNLSLNYAYRLGERYQLGGFYQNQINQYKFNTPDSSAKTEVRTQVFGAFLLYNFSDTISSAWYSGASVAIYQNAEETSHNAAAAESKNPFELDDAGEIYEIVIGKRFRLLKWNIDHLTYAPQLGVYMKTHGKDFKDQNVSPGYGLTFQPIRFDILF